VFKKKFVNELFLIVILMFLASCGGGSGGGTLAPGGTLTPGGTDVPLPDNELPLFQRGQVEFDAKNYALAVQAFDKLLTTYAGGRYAEPSLHLRARSHYELGQYDDAIADFEAFLAQYSGSSDAASAQYWYGRTLHATQAYDAAATAYNKVIGDYGNSSLVDDANYQLAKILYDKNDFQAAIDAFIVFVANFNQSILVNSAHYYRGRSLQQSAIPDYAAARDAFALVSDQSVLFDNAAYQSAKTYYDAFDYANAVSNLSVFIAAHGDSSYLNNANYYLGRSYHESTPPDFVDARIYYNKLIHLTDSNWADDAVYQIGKTYYDEARDEAAAARAAADAAAAKPHYVNAYNLYQSAKDEFDPFSADPGLQLSNRVDAALYFTGRSLHERADLLMQQPFLDDTLLYDALFSAARASYSALVQLKTSSWGDNAQYQLAKTYYDSAVFQQNTGESITLKVAPQDLNAADIAEAQSLYDSAVGAYSLAVDAFLPLFDTPENFPDASADDDGRYFLARTKQRVADINTEQLRIDTTFVATVNFSWTDAIAEFDILIADYADTGWKDNALYESGNLYSLIATSPLSVNQVAEFNAALDSYAAVLNVVPVSRLVDNAGFKLGMVYHTAHRCGDEDDAFNYLNGIVGASSIWLNAADKALSSRDCTATPLDGVKAFGNLILPATLNIPAK